MKAHTVVLAVGLIACLAWATASAQQAPFTLDDRFDALLDRIEGLEAELQATGAERVSLRRDLAAALERESALADRIDAAERARDEAFAARDAAVAEAALEQDRRETVAEDRDLAVAERDAAIEASEALTAQLDAARAELDAAELRVAEARSEREATERSRDAELQARLDALIEQRNAALADGAVERAKVAALALSLEEATRAASLAASDRTTTRGGEAEDAPGPETEPGPEPRPEPGPEPAADAIVAAPSVEPSTCADKLTTDVEGVVASIVVTNPCRAGGTLRVRAADPTDPLLGQLRAGFDATGRANLRFPLLRADTRLRVFGEERGDFQDVVLDPDAGAAGTLAVLRWEDASVDLDLVVRAGGEAETSLGPRADVASVPGRYLLAQGTEADQLPRFEVFVPDANAPALALGVDHASRGARADAPYCDDADAGAPRLLVTLRSGGNLQQIRDAFDALPCGSDVPDAERGRVLRTLR